MSTSETSGMNVALEKAAAILHEANRVVCLTGAGVSAESGITTFRDAQTGLWTRFNPQQLASQAGFDADPSLVWRWYMHRLAVVEQAIPNPGHQSLAELEKITPNFTLITQNIDDLHERAGSRRILHLHGTISRFHCNDCGFSHDLLERERKALLPPHCVNCKGPVRPSVVWFGEALPARVLDQAWRESERCKVMLVVGTSGVVYPAAQLPFLAQQLGAQIIEINIDDTPVTEIADIVLSGPSGQVLPELLASIRRHGD